MVKTDIVFFPKKRKIKKDIDGVDFLKKEIKEIKRTLSDILKDIEKLKSKTRYFQ